MSGSSQEGHPVVSAGQAHKPHSGQMRKWNCRALRYQLAGLRIVPVQTTACRVELPQLIAGASSCQFAGASVASLLYQKQWTGVPVLLTLILGSWKFRAATEADNTATNSSASTVEIRGMSKALPDRSVRTSSDVAS